MCMEYSPLLLGLMGKLFLQDKIEIAAYVLRHIEHEKNESLKRRIVLVAFLLFLIPAGISIGDQPTMDNLSRGKSFSGVSEQTNWICSELHTLYGEHVDAVLPREFQMEVGIADTGVHCISGM